MAQIVIEVDNPTLLLDLFDAKTVTSQMTREIPGGGTLTYSTPYVERRGGLTHDAAPIIAFIVTAGKDVAIGLLANWLFTKLTSKPTRRVTINRQIVEHVTEDRLTRIITEQIEGGG
jgi:hypothetical protein